MSLDYNIDFISDKAKKSTIKKAIAILERAYYRNMEETSFFLDPFDQEVIESIARKNNIDIAFIGANEDAERKIFVANYYYEPVDAANYLSVLSFDHEDLGHPDVLGGLMSLNIGREAIGDIVISDGKCEFAILKDEAAFVKYNLTKIKREGISIDFKDKVRLDLPEPEFSYHAGFVSSLRLDNLVALFTKTSRSKAKDLIKYKNVRVNFETIDDPAKIIGENSTISIRKEGRFIFDGITGASKKGNHHIKYRKLL